MDEVYKKAEKTPDQQSKANWIEKKKQQRADAYALIAETTEKLKVDPEAFRRYLRVQGRFDRYSVSNAILVSAQMPEATELRDYKGWKEEKAYLDRGTTGISILEPGKVYTRPDGTSAQGFDAKTVYDISQTSARLRPKAEEKALSIHTLLLALMDASPLPFAVEENLPEPAMFDAGTQTIRLARNVPEEALFVAMAAEIAAAVFYLQTGEARESSYFKAWCVTCLLLVKFGAVEELSLPELPADYSTLENAALKKELSEIRDVFGDIQKDMYHSLKKEAAK